MWPPSHQSFLDRALPILKQDPRILGVAAAGSRLSGELDEYSDLDLVVVVEPAPFPAVLRERNEIAAKIGGLLSSFSGEHMGAPSLTIALYEEPLLHVDLKFVSLDDFRQRTEDPEVLWERENRLTETIAEFKPESPVPSLQWIEDRFWTWIHYGAQRLGRGEIFEAIDHLCLIRRAALGPLVFLKNGVSSRGVRRIEEYGGEYLSSLRATIPLYDARSCELSLREAAKLYVDLRETLAKPDLVRHRRTEMAAMRYLHEVSEKLGG